MHAQTSSIQSTQSSDKVKKMENFELVERIIICLMYGMIVDFSGYISQYGPLYYKVCLNWNFPPLIEIRD